MTREPELEVLAAWGLRGAALEPARRLLEALEQGDTGLVLPELEAASLRESPAVGEGSLPTPLVLGPDGLLQSWRFRCAERAVAQRLRELAQAPDRVVSPQALAALEALYPGAPGHGQARAIELGLRRRLALVTGGPGTGKTRTAAWLLALQLLQRPGLRCLLAAPTGKAARRLGQSIRAAAGVLPPPLAGLKGPLETAAAQAHTLHRLLAWRPQEDRCGRDARHPLNVDLLIVDEASMMDVLQWRALLAALPPEAALVVLGDPQQLQSVEAGRVLGVLVEAAAPASGRALAGHHVELTENFRFAAHPGIGALATALRHQAQGKALLAASPAPRTGLASDVEGLRSGDLEQALERIWPEILALAFAPDAETALRALEGLRVLCAVNEGPWGVDGVNRRIERKLAERAREEGRADWCRPCIILANDPSTGLSNGDLGILMPAAAGGRAWFDQGSGPADFAPARLPGHGLAWAMSVHRSQGSEYAVVLVLLPRGDKITERVRGLLSPELLYTAVTRATRRVILCADLKSLETVCAPRGPRVTGLAQWLS